MIDKIAKTEVLFRTLNGHTSYVSSVAWSPDGTLLSSGYYNNNINLWYSGVGAMLNTMTGHTGPVYSVAWSSDGTIKPWDAL